MRTTAKTDAFTLLELLVAVAITLVIAGLMLTVTTQVLGLWQRTQGAHSQAASARQVFDLIGRDLQAALHRRDARCWLALDILDAKTSLANHGWLLDAALPKPASGGSLRPLPDADANGVHRLRDARFGLSGAWLRLVTTNVESGGSLPAVVAYQVARRPVSGDPVATNLAPVRYSLYRSVVSPEETFDHGYDVMATTYGSTSNTPTSALSTAYRQPRNVTNPSHANLLASNVVDFGCWLYRRDSAGELVRIYPGATGDVSHHAVGQSTTDDSRFPAVVDVMLRVLSESGASLLEAIESGRVTRPSEHASDAAWWWAVVEAHSTVFTRRIEIQGAAP
ncbi:type II secretion system protein [Oleiharenicola lentus]|jgi:type II secretory pathway pseudopilin PulG|uniref:Type II secretion system protein n=1 Tax=Oleiharenicola lentus TaxID=2508720 RepID=A0A4Q1CBK9_9BACT|nr:type II secretion system protein [Oleiharenicola lentus]RXK56301.1 type II secretion system protein [Oleiharenicola lentus]